MSSVYESRTNKSAVVKGDGPCSSVVAVTERRPRRLCLVLWSGYISGTVEVPVGNGDDRGARTLLVGKADAAARQVSVRRYASATIATVMTQLAIYFLRGLRLA